MPAATSLDEGITPSIFGIAVVWGGLLHTVTRAIGYASAPLGHGARGEPLVQPAPAITYPA